MHLAQVHATDVVTAVENYVCAKLESPLDEACRRLLQEFGPILIDGIYHNRTPDMLCHDVRLLLHNFYYIFFSKDFSNRILHKIIYFLLYHKSIIILQTAC